MSNSLKAAMGIVGLVIATQAAAQVTFYSRDGFRGESFTADREIRNMERTGFNDRAQSAVVQGGSWQVCEDARFEGRCAVLRPGESRRRDSRRPAVHGNDRRASDCAGYEDWPSDLGYHRRKS